MSKRMTVEERRTWLAQYGHTYTDQGYTLNPQGQVVCGAKTSNGTPCKKAPTPGMTRCYMHGGKTPVGAAAPTFKTGRYSKYLPNRLAARYHEAQSDPYILNQQEEIALLDARIAELLTSVDEGGGRALWEQARKTFKDLRFAQTTQDTEGIVTALRTLDALINKGAAEGDTWAEVYDLVERRRRLVESERKRFVELGQMVTASQLMTMMGAISSLIREHVTDRDALRAISTGILALTGSGVALPGGEPEFG